MARKTIEVDQVRDWANTFLAAPNSVSSVADPVSQRMGVCALVEAVLHRSGNYCGFRYLTSEKHDDGSLREDHDDSRRQYL
jgi:hypothetical protein